MKYSDDTEEHRKANIGYASERWRQLYELQNDWGTEGIKYLLLVNSGAAVAMLAFLGSVAKARDLSWPKVTLGFFALGIVLVGLLHALRHFHVSQLFKKWRESVNEYYTEQKDWGQIIDEDKKRSERFDWALGMAYLSFACFIAGIVIGMFNFSDLTSGEENGRKETRVTCAFTQTSCPTTTDNNTGLRSGAGNQSDTKQSATGTDSKKEIKHLD